MARKDSARLNASARLASHASFDRPKGRRFGLTVGAAFLGLAALLWWRGHLTAAAASGMVGVLLGLAGVAIPGRLGPVWRMWMGLARILSRVVTPVVMGLLYYLLITPVGLLRRTLGRNPLERTGEDETYWVPRDDESVRGGLNRQF